MISEKKLKFNIFKNNLAKHINKKDSIYIEFDTTKFRLDNVKFKNRNQFVNFYFNLFKQLLGSESLFITPSFSYSFSKNEKNKIFDIKKSIPKTSIIAKYLFKRKNISRTIDPMFSVLIFGKNKKKYLVSDNDSFGPNSIFDKIFKENFKLISFGIDKFDPTFVHYVEQYFNEFKKKIKYRKIYKINGTIIDKIKKKITYKSFLRVLSKRRVYDDKNILFDLKKQKKINHIKIFNGNIYICNAQDYFNQAIKGLSKNINYLSKKI